MAYRWQLNVIINAAPRDTNNVEGLCGNINGDRRDDFIVNGRDYGAQTRCGGGFICRNQFIDLYKVSADKQFFPPSAANKNIFELRPDQVVCTCPLNEAHGVAKSECSSKAFVKCKSSREKHLTCTETNVRKKRDIERRIIYIQQHLEKFSKALSRRKRSVPQRTITKEQAQIICQAKFSNAGSFRYCQSHVSGIENTQEIQNCIFDLNVTGITDWAEDALGSITEECTHEAEKNNSLQESTNGAPSVAEVIQEITCLNECSGNGDCRNGSCICNDDFTGSDCSFERRKAPIVHPDVGDTVCDKSEGSCNHINVFGEDFIDSENLTCSIKEYQMSIRGTIIAESSIRVHGDARSPFEVRCPIIGFKKRRQAPSTNDIVFFRKYVIAIANDGLLFGIEKDVYVADSTCQKQTNISNVFEVKAGYCFIDGKCVAKGESLEGDRHKVCLPKNQTFHWTHVENIAPVVTEPCQIYKDIPDVLRRLESYQPSLDEDQINDYFLEEGWYGKVGYDMLQKMPVNVTACGTLSPIWLQGSLPDSIGATKTVSACVTGWLPGCVLDIPVEIKNCSTTLNVYYLRPSEIALAGYCFVMNGLVSEHTTISSTESLTTEKSTLMTSPPKSTSTSTATTTTLSSTSTTTSSTPTTTSSTSSAASSTSTRTPSSTSMTTSSTPTTSSTSSTTSSTPTSTSSPTSITTRTTTPVSTVLTTMSTFLTTFSISQSSHPSITQQSTSPIISMSKSVSKVTKTPNLSSTTTSNSNGNEEGQQGQNYLWVIGVIVAAFVGMAIVIGVAVYLNKRWDSRSLPPDHDTSRIIDKNDKDDVPIESDPHGDTETRDGENEDRV